MDAKVYAMIEDMSRDAILQLCDHSPVAVHLGTDYLRSFIRQQYETGELEEFEIIEAWDDDGDPDYDDNGNLRAGVDH